MSSIAVTELLPQSIFSLTQDLKITQFRQEKQARSSTKVPMIVTPDGKHFKIAERQFLHL